MEFKILKQNLVQQLPNRRRLKEAKKGITNVERAIDQFFANILTADI